MFYPYMTRKQLKRHIRKGDTIALFEWLGRYHHTPRESQCHKLWCS